jgi:beta-glucosidase
MKQLRLWMLLLLVGLATSLWAQEPVRILAVGNSFAQDAVEQNLHELAAAEGIQTIIANMYIGGCSLERHLNNARKNRADYAYRKIGLDGVKRTRKGVTLAEALADEEWDYVSVQQVSGQRIVSVTVFISPKDVTEED